MSLEQITNAPALYVNGMLSSYASTTSLTITSGQCRDSTNNYDITIGAVTTLNASINGANGLDTGSLASSKMYVIYAIHDAAGYLPDAYILSLSRTAPTLPTGYGAFRIIGYWPTDSSSHFIVGYVTSLSGSRSFMYDAPQATAITAGAATSYTAVDLSNIVPIIPGLNTSFVYILADINPAVAGHTLKLQPVNGTGDAITVTGQVATVHVTQQVKVLAQIASGAPKVNYKVANASDAAAISVLGFDYSL